MSINKEERDKFLVKLIDEKLYVPDFSTWEGFGKLWEFVKKQEWKWDFWEFVGSYCSDDRFVSSMNIINPDMFADMVYEFLNKKE